MKYTEFVSKINSKKSIRMCQWPVTYSQNMLGVLMQISNPSNIALLISDADPVGQRKGRLLNMEGLLLPTVDYT